MEKKKLKNSSESKKYLIGGGILLIVSLVVGLIIGYRYYSENLRERSYKATLKKADSHFEAGEFEKAKEAYLKAIEMKSETADILRRLAASELASGNREASKKYYLRAAEKDLNDHISRYQLALIFYEQGFLAEAERWAKESIKARSSYIAPRIFLGNLYLKKGQLSKAQGMFLEILKINPSIEAGRKDILKNIAHIYEKQGNKPQAVYYYQQALSLDPADSDILRALKRLDVKI